MAILIIFTGMMNVRYQSIQAFVTGFGTLCTGSCKFVRLTIEYELVQNVPSTSISEQFESILLTNSPTDFNSTSLK